MCEAFRIVNVENVKFENGMDFKRFVSQFQNYSPKLLSIVDNSLLQIYEKKDQI